MSAAPVAPGAAAVAAGVARLVIPTTNGPVDVVYLARDPDLDTSIVCINGSANQAGMSAAYGAFVRRGTGVIERYVAPGNFRLDLSERIDVGDSWKLGIFLAHALQAQQRLSLPLDAEADPGAPKVVVWATGAVRSVDLAVGEVANVAEKLRFSLPMFETARAVGLRCLAVLPRGNADDGDPGTMARLRALGVELLAVRQVDEALRALGLPLPARAASAEPTEGPQWQGNPFRGLEPFTPDHRRVFFGRARAREEVVERLITAAEMGRAFVLIHGRSGSGKSSLALAGIAGDVAARPLSDGVWQVATMRPGDAPLAALSTALAPWTAGADQAVDALATPRDWVDRVVEAMQAQRPSVSVVLVIDQLEDLLAAPSAQIVAFGEAVEAMAESGRIWIVSTIRTDRLNLLDAAPALARLASSDRTFRLDRPTPFELFEMVTQPAAMAGLRFESPASGAGLPDRLANLAMQSPDSLPLLQAVLTRLAERANAGVLTEEAYDRIGRFEGAISRWADESLVPLRRAGIGEADIDRALAELVRFAPDTGAALAREAIVGGDPARQAVFDALVAARVASVGTRPDGSSAVRVAHEALMAHWGRLRVLADRLRADLVTRDWLEAAAARWVDGGRVNGDLLGNPLRISEARRLLLDRLVAVEGEAEPFVARSEAHLAEIEQAALRLAQAEAERASAELAREATARRLAEAEASRTNAELEREAARRRLVEARGRTQRLLLAIGAVAVVVLGGVAVMLFQLAGAAADQRDHAIAQQKLADHASLAARIAAGEAQRQAERAQIELARRNALAADAYRAAGNRQQALATALESLPSLDGPPSRPMVSEPLVSLAKTLRDYRKAWTVDSNAHWLSTSFLADGTLLALREGDSQVHRFSVTGQVLEGFEVAFTPESGQKVLAAPKGPIALTCGSKFVIHNVETGSVWTVPSALSGRCDDVAASFSGDGSRLLLHDTERLELVDVAGQRMISAGLPNLPRNIEDAGFRGTDPVVLGYDDDAVELKAVIGGSTPGERTFTEFDGASDMARLSPNGAILVVVRAKKNSSTVYDVVSGQSPGWVRFPGVGFTISPDGRWLLVEENIDSRLWSLDLQLVFTTYVQFAKGGTVADFSPDSRSVATIDDRETLWNNSAGWGGDESITVSPIERPQMHTVRFSPDGRRIAVSYDGVLGVWDVMPSFMQGQFASRYGSISGFLVSDDGARVLGRDSRGVSVWDRAIGQLLNRFAAGPVVSDQLSADGAYYVAIQPDNSVDIWATGVPRTAPALHIPASGHGIPLVDIAADGRLATVIADAGAVVQRFELPSGRIVAAPTLDAWAAGQPAPGGGVILRSLATPWQRALLTSDARLVMLDAAGKERWQVATGLFGAGGTSPGATDLGRFKLSFAQEGKRLLLSGPLSSTLYGTATGITIETFGATEKDPLGHVYESQISDDGTTLLAGGPNGSAKVIDLMTGLVRDQFDAGSYPRLVEGGSQLLSLDYGRIRAWPLLDPMGLTKAAKDIPDLHTKLPDVTPLQPPDAPPQGRSIEPTL